MISRIKTENFKSIKHLDIRLRPINILIGANGVGKSNFIEIFKLLNQIYEQRLQEYIGNDIDSLLYFGRKKSDFLSMLLFSTVVGVLAKRHQQQHTTTKRNFSIYFEKLRFFIKLLLCILTI